MDTVVGCKHPSKDPLCLFQTPFTFVYRKPLLCDDEGQFDTAPACDKELIQRCIGHSTAPLAQFPEDITRPLLELQVGSVEIDHLQLRVSAEA